jgi:hypothetical protein
MVKERVSLATSAVQIPAPTTFYGHHSPDGAVHVVCHPSRREDLPGSMGRRCEHIDMAAGGRNTGDTAGTPRE